jgi:plasmid stability protein
MKNITVSVDDDTYRRARIKAAERDTSVSALVRRYLNELAGEEDEFDRLLRKEQELREQVRGFDGGDRLPRNEMYERRR